ncbi:MAG: PHP domain-containing protein [Planctomycetota bacterium]
MRCDFHLHTNMSDGRVTPEALVFKASARNLDLIAVTDHDTTAGFEAARAEGEWLGVKVIPGVELSASVGDKHVHLICLGFDNEDAALQTLLEKIRASREKAGRETLERLSLAGYGAEVELGVNERALCRPHLADALVRAGHARTRNEAFDRFLSSDTYRSQYSLPKAEDAIATVHAAGGIAIYAHPSMDELDSIAPYLKDHGLDGIEVFRAAWPKSPRGLYIEDAAKRLDLMVAGGSDWHGIGTLGEFALTREQAGPLVERVA